MNNSRFVDFPSKVAFPSFCEDLQVTDDRVKLIASRLRELILNNPSTDNKQLEIEAKLGLLTLNNRTLG